MAHTEPRPISFTYPPVATMWVVTHHNLFLYSDPSLHCHPPSYWLRLFSSQTFSHINTPTFSNLVIHHTFYTSLRKGDSHIKHNSLTCTAPWLTPTRALSPSHTRPWPPCGSLPSTTCFCTRTRHYTVTFLPTGSSYFRAQTFPFK
jgi:hypothetical protein